MTTLVLTFVLVILAGIANAIKDASALRKFESAFWNKSESWSFKWSSIKVASVRHWWYLGLLKTSHPERFPFSSTILVGFTDGWHLAQLVQFTCLQVIISYHTPIMELVGVPVCPFVLQLMDFAVIKTTFSLSFQALYQKLSR
jgi:hypothetical protein